MLAAFMQMSLLGKALIVLALVLLIAFAAVLLRKPRQDRDWVEALSQQVEVEPAGDAYHFGQIRNWRWNAKGDLSRDYISATYSGSDIVNMWFLLEPFEGSRWVGHTFLLFEMSDGRVIGLTVEARKVKGQTYSPLRGIFNAYELIYLWGTAEDLLGHRAHRLQNPQYAWRLMLKEDEREAVFNRLIATTRELAERPRFYNTLWNNCTNELAQSVELDWGWAYILTGRSISYLHRRGYLVRAKDEGVDLSPIVRGIELTGTEFDAALRTVLHERTF